MPTKIEWCDEVWNPIVGCTPISEGCDHCYAERIAHRFDYGGFDGMASFHDDRMAKPRSWREPRRIFVNSMGDLFHDSVPFDWLENVWNEMGDHLGRHTFLLLTKRPARMLEWFNTGRVPTLLNLWLGVTAENQARWDERVPILTQCPSVARFVSVEPMLGPVIPVSLCGIDWVICGAETGTGKRPMDPTWYLSLARECSLFGVPFYGKKDSDRNPLEPRQFPNSPAAMDREANERPSKVSAQGEGA